MLYEVITAKEVTDEDGSVSYVVAEAPYPSQCVQPIASYAKWGDIGTPGNSLPLIMIYDPTWERTECAVGELLGSSVNEEGILVLNIDEYYIPPSEYRNNFV